MPSIPHRSHLGRRTLQSVLSDLARLPARAMRKAALWFEVRRQMRQLADLDQHLLRDIGLSEADRRAAIIAPNRKQAAKEH